MRPNNLTQLHELSSATVGAAEVASVVVAVDPECSMESDFGCICCRRILCIKVVAPIKRVQLGPISTSALFVSIFQNQVHRDVQCCGLIGELSCMVERNIPMVRDLSMLIRADPEKVLLSATLTRVETAREA